MKGILWSGALAALLCLPAVTWSADQDKDKKEEKGQDRAGKDLPHMQYRHTSTRNNVCTFQLDGDKGTADYVFGGQRRKDNLVYDRTDTVGRIKGWVYQVERDGKKQPMWFFFGSQARRTRSGQQSYPMFYAQGGGGRAAWRAIPTRSGTRATPLGDEGRQQKPDKGGKPKPKRVDDEGKQDKSDKAANPKPKQLDDDK